MCVVLVDVLQPACPCWKQDTELIFLIVACMFGMYWHVASLVHLISSMVPLVASKRRHLRPDQPSTTALIVRIKDEARSWAAAEVRGTTACIRVT